MKHLGSQTRDPPIGVFHDALWLHLIFDMFLRLQLENFYFGCIHVIDSRNMYQLDGSGFQGGYSRLAVGRSYFTAKHPQSLKLPHE